MPSAAHRRLMYVALGLLTGLNVGLGVCMVRLEVRNSDLQSQIRRNEQRFFDHEQRLRRIEFDRTQPQSHNLFRQIGPPEGLPRDSNPNLKPESKNVLSIPPSRREPDQRMETLFKGDSQ